MDQRYLLTLPEEMAAINSASVELVAVIDWVFERYVMTPPARRNACPVVDQHLWRSFAWVSRDNIQRDAGESHDGLGAPVNDTPFNGIAKILRDDTFELGIMDLGRSNSKFGKGSNDAFLLATPRKSLPYLIQSLVLILPNHFLLPTSMLSRPLPATRKALQSTPSSPPTWASLTALFSVSLYMHMSPPVPQYWIQLRQLATFQRMSSSFSLVLTRGLAALGLGFLKIS
jgi:hypothetical protein